MAICSYPLAKVLMGIGRPQERLPRGWKWEPSLAEGVCGQSAQSSGGVTWVSGTPAAVLGVVTGVTATRCLCLYSSQSGQLLPCAKGRSWEADPGSPRQPALLAAPAISLTLQ